MARVNIGNGHIYMNRCIYLYFHFSVNGAHDGSGPLTSGAGLGDGEY